MAFGKILRKARKDAGLSQSEIAELLYMPRSSISKIENDKADLKAETLIRWGKVTSMKWGQMTSMPEVAAATICATDIANVMQVIMQLFGG